MAFCSKCGTRIDSNAKFCERCGAPNRAAVSACAHCGAKIDGKAKYCKACGTARTRNKILLAVAIAVVLVPFAAGVIIGFENRKAEVQTYKRAVEALYDERYDAAITGFGEAIRLDTNNAGAYFNRGLAYHCKKDYDSAIENFNRAIELNPDDWQAYKGRGAAYYDDWLACLGKGGGCNQKKDYRIIAADFNKSIELYPDYADKLPAAGIPRITNGYKLHLLAIITDSVITIGAKGGFMPSIFYKEFHRYVSRERDFDTIMEYTPGGAAPIHPKSGRSLTPLELYGFCLYMTDDNRNVIRSMYTKSGVALTDSGGKPVKSVNAGDTVYMAANPRGRVVVADPADFESRPLSAYDELMNRLMKIKERYHDAEDADSIIVAVEYGVDYAKVIPVMCAARIAGYSGIYLGSFNDDVIKILRDDEVKTAEQQKADSSWQEVFRTDGGGTFLLPKELFARRQPQAVEDASLVKSGALSGGRSRASIQRVVMQNMAALRYIYNRRLREKPGLKGKVTVKFAVDEFGKVIFAKVVESTMNDPELENLVLGRVKDWNFDRIDKPGDVTEVVYPFVFSE